MEFVDSHEAEEDARKQEEQDILDDIAREEAGYYDEPGYYD